MTPFQRNSSDYPIADGLILQNQGYPEVQTYLLLGNTVAYDTDDVTTYHYCQRTEVNRKLQPLRSEPIRSYPIPSH